MSDWEDDDYDASAQLSEARLVELGLDTKKADVKTAAAAGGDKKSTAAVTTNGSRDNNQQFREFMTDEEKRAAQLAGDLEHARGLLGIDDESSGGQAYYSDFSASNLRTKEDFVRYGERLGAEVANRSDSPYYLDMVIALMEHIVKPMKKIPLESVDAVIRKHLDVFLKKEEAELQKVAEQKQQREQKKKKKKQLNEDLVEDEFDDYGDKFF